MDSFSSRQTTDSDPSQMTTASTVRQEQLSGQARRNKRRTVSKELMQIIVYLHEREPILSLLEISRVVNLSYSCVKNVVKKIHESEASEIWEFAIEKKGRKEKITGKWPSWSRHA